MAAQTTELEQLHLQGMEHYQRREWRQALDYFTRLKKLQPARQGLDELLDEVRWFIQLEAMEGGTGGALGTGAAVADSADPSLREQPDRRRRSFLPALVALLILLLVAFLIPGGLRDLLFDNKQQEMSDLYNQGIALLSAGDYDGAINAFEAILTLAPGNTEAQTERDRAVYLQKLAQLYAQAKAAILVEKWDDAAALLDQVLSIDPNYSPDAQSLAAMVKRRQTLLSLYNSGLRAYDQGQCGDAIEQFKQVRSLDATFRSEGVQEYLFNCYLNEGKTRIAQAGTSEDNIKAAIEQFGSALSLRPRNVQATDERELASYYLDGVRFYNAADWDRAQGPLERVYAARPDYAGGQAAQLLYLIYLGRAGEYMAAEQYTTALQSYRKAQDLEVKNKDKALEGEARALQALATPTPTSTPTHTPTATATLTPTRTPTAVPPTRTLTPTATGTATPVPPPTDTPQPPPPPPPTATPVR